jgi:hypothetical protein
LTITSLLRAPGIVKRKAAGLRPPLLFHFPSLPGFVPAIHVFLACYSRDVDARDEARA